MLMLYYVYFIVIYNDVCVRDMLNILLIWEFAFQLV